jgi:diguanylate cyclase (GGDEF)-like protein/PAS domain S-box-containing protein
LQPGTRIYRILRRGIGTIAEPYVFFPLVAVVLLGVVWGLTLNLIHVERGIASRAAAASSLELADTYEAQVVRALREIDQTLKLVRFAHERNGGSVDLAELKDKGLMLPEILFVVTLVDEKGDVVASTRTPDFANVANQGFFREARAGTDIAVSRPLVSAADKETKLHFARRLEEAGNGRGGAVIVSVPAWYFVAGYEPSKVGHQGVLGLLGLDGIFRSRRTGEAVAAGDSTDYKAVVRSDQETTPFVAANGWDGVRRFTIGRKLFDFPLAVVVGLSEEEQLAPIREHARLYLWRAAGGSLVLVLLLGGLGRMSWTLSQTRLRANRALQEEVTVRRHAEAALKLRNRAIESSVNAIVITDASRAGDPIEYVNPAFERITGYESTEVTGRDMSFLLGPDAGQPGMQEVRRAVRDRREGHAVLRSYRKDGSLFWNDFYIAPVRNERGEVTHYVGVMNDVTEAKRYEEQLAHQANFDTLTGLANRNLLHDRLHQAIANARRTNSTAIAVLLDVDNFKVINDTLGHGVGDRLLQQVAARLQTCVRESDTVARLGGYEFVLVLQNMSGDPALAAGNEGEAATLESDITSLMHKLLTGIAHPIALGDRSVNPTVSIGVAIYPQDGQDVETLLRNADAAMYRAKELGRNRFQFFTSDVHERIRRRMELESSLRLALERDEFTLHYQPQVDLKSGAIVGVEALLRWLHPDKGLIGPAQFIAFAEETGLIVDIGKWVLHEACRQNKAWQDAGLPAVPIAVNMSARQCEQPGVEDMVRRAITESGLAPHYLELEITESISMAHPEQSVPLMERLKAIGVALSIDDFGTGFSNLSYLRRFPVDRLKIDLSFVREITTDASSLAISEAIITMSHSLNLEVIAEGVETAAQFELLGSRHCDQIQGYLFSPPVTAEAFARLLREDRRLPYRPGTTVHAPPATIM